MSSLSALSNPAAGAAAPWLTRTPSPAKALGQPSTARNGGDALDSHVQQLGSSTLGYAQDFLSGFASNVLGADAKDLQFSFDNFDLSASSSVTAAALSANGPGGALQAAGASMDDAADFTGSGTITTADGRRFRFSIEVHYAMHAEASAASASNAPSAAPQDDAQGNSQHDLQLPFDGGLADLMRLFRNGSLQGAFSQPDAKGGEAHKGNFLLHLLDELPRAQDPAKDSPARAYQNLGDTTPAPGAVLATSA